LLLAAGLSPGISKGLSFLCGVGFPLNKFLTFAQGPTAASISARKTGPEIIRYLAVYAASLAVNIGVNAAVLGLLGAQAKLLGFLVATGVTTVMNFVCLKWLVFRPNSSATELRMESLT
jgi:putative flippase GtrA